MARINTADLIELARPHIARAVEVQKEPAVRKAWRTASGDVVAAGRSVATAARSVGQACAETAAAWHRLGPAVSHLATA